MRDPSALAVDVRCLDCGDEVLRTEAAPGAAVQMPDHDCKDAR